MSTSELVRQLALARANKVLHEQSTGSGGVLLGGKFLLKKHKKKAQTLRRKRQTHVEKKSGRKINLYAELLHACGKKKARADIASGKYVKTQGLSGKKLISARHANKRAINRCIGHKIRKGTFSKKKHYGKFGKGMLMDPFMVPQQMYPKPMYMMPRLMKQPMLGMGGEFDNPIGGAYSGGYYSGGEGAGFWDSIKPKFGSLKELIMKRPMVGLGGAVKKKVTRKSPYSPWITYVKHYAKAKGIGYGEALQRAGPSYRKMYG